MSTEEPGLDLERERIELETGLNEGSIPLFGDPDGAPFAPKPFLEVWRVWGRARAAMLSLVLTSYRGGTLTKPFPVATSMNWNERRSMSRRNTVRSTSWISR